MTMLRDIFKTFRLFKKMNLYPHLMGLMHTTFLDIMEQKGIITRERIHQQAQEELKADGLPDTEINRQEYVEALTEYYFANALSPAEIESYVNLARKREKAQSLSMMVNRDQTTDAEVIASLRDFCDIPMGEVYITLS